MATRFPSLSKRLDIGLDVHMFTMFTEDIWLKIMPIGGRTKNQENFAKLQGDKIDCEKAEEIIGELGQGKFDKHDISAMVCDAVDNITRHLAWEGEGQVVYEIINDNEQIYINSFTSKNLIKVFLWYLQIIPPGDWDLWKRKFTLVGKKKIWKVNIPNKLGGVKGFKKVLKRLRKYNQFRPMFYSRDLEREIITKNYDRSKYVRNNEIYCNRITHVWGWNRRDRSQKKCTEFYTFYKMLSFKYAQALLREHIIKEINQLLNRLSIKCELIVTGLPTPKEILQIRSDMQKGDLSFTAALDKAAM